MRKSFYIQLVSIAVCGSLLIVFRDYFDNNTKRYLTDLFLLITAAQLWNLLAGYCGMVSVGQHVFVGLGAYAFFGFSVHAGMHPFMAMAATIPFCAVAALPIYAVVARLRTAYFAIGTWVVAEVVSLAAGKLSAFGSGSGLSMPVKLIKTFGRTTSGRIDNLYLLTLGLALLTIVIIVAIMYSRYGLALKAVRDNQTAATAFGVNPGMIKAVLYVLTGALLGLVGALATVQKLRVSPDGSFSLNDWTVFIIFIVVLGGIGNVAGPVVGAVLFIAIRETLADAGPTYLILLGILAIVFMVWSPGGIIQMTRTLMSSMKLGFREAGK